jgi:transposase InsO family protein
MDVHKNARLTYARRLEMARDVVDRGVPLARASDRYGVSVPTVRKWACRYRAEGEAGLMDRSSRPHGSPRRLPDTHRAAMVELRRRRLTHGRIARSIGVSARSVGRHLARVGLSRLADLEPSEPIVRYEHALPGDLVHIDTKKLGRIERLGHRVTGDRRDTTDGAGWEFLFVAVDDRARLGFTQMKPNERKDCAIAFLKAMLTRFAFFGVKVRRILTDNGSAFRSKRFAAACRALGIKHSFTRPYRPQTNGKAERFIQSALREWAYGIAYHHSSERTAMLSRWTHHYNWHRPHQGIGGHAPVSRLGRTSNNLLTLHS